MHVRRLMVQLAPPDDGAAGASAAAADTGGSGDGGAADAGSGGGQQSAAPADGGGSGATSALAAAVASTAPAADGGSGGQGGAAAEQAAIPEKFIVKNEAGEIDHAATALKIAREGYLPLERKLGGGQVAPKTVDDYKVTIPEALAGKFTPDQLMNEAGFKDFLSKAHGAGLTQQQLDVMVGDFLERGASLRVAAHQMAAADCEAQLRQGEGWKTDSEYAQQCGLAFNAIRSLFGNDAQAVVNEYGNDPRFVRAMASLGREVEEDRPPPAEAVAQLNESLDQLMSSPAYLNPSNPQHASTVAKVEALTKRVAGSKPVAGGRTLTFHS